MSPPKDRWDKLGVVMQPLGGLLTAVSVAIVGIAGSQVIDRQQTKSTDARLYSELMSQREQAESNLRKDMLVSVIQSYLAPDAGSLDAHLLHLELLAYNFHDSLNLEPLFLDLARKLQAKPGVETVEQFARLRRIAREISDRQRFALELRGDSFRRTVDLAELEAQGRAGLALDPATVKVEGRGSEISLRVLRADREARSLMLRLEVSSLSEEGVAQITRTEFEVGFFDFPMIDSTHLANGQRCAVVLSAFGQETADLATVCFPGEYASLKDRPYYDEVVEQLRIRREAAE
ncbi:MAG TPA: hypothetical protein VJV23_13145 [Candidatus Polarisedimenticolia bacterium]|nr:hypothetical protein [Candidatus Polarisedimenticolia bacterium]